jgi:hypothetical protein
LYTYEIDVSHSRQLEQRLLVAAVAESFAPGREQNLKADSVIVGGSLSIREVGAPIDKFLQCDPVEARLRSTVPVFGEWAVLATVIAAFQWTPVQQLKCRGHAHGHVSGSCQLVMSASHEAGHLLDHRWAVEPRSDCVGVFETLFRQAQDVFIEFGELSLNQIAQLVEVHEWGRPK